MFEKTMVNYTHFRAGFHLFKSHLDRFHSHLMRPRDVHLTIPSFDHFALPSVAQSSIPTNHCPNGVDLALLQNSYWQEFHSIHAAQRRELAYTTHRGRRPRLPSLAHCCSRRNKNIACGGRHRGAEESTRNLYSSQQDGAIQRHYEDHVRRGQRIIGAFSHRRPRPASQSGF
jgi:hypothetical protein